MSFLTMIVWNKFQSELTSGRPYRAKHCWHEVVAIRAIGRESIVSENQVGKIERDRRNAVLPEAFIRSKNHMNGVE